MQGELSGAQRAVDLMRAWDAARERAARASARLEEGDPGALDEYHAAVRDATAAWTALQRAKH